MNKLIGLQPSICLVHIAKHRFSFRYSPCQAELTVFWANGPAMQTLAVKAEELETVQQLRKKRGLQDFTNVNYPLAWQCIMSLASPLFANSDTWLLHGGGLD